MKQYLGTLWLVPVLAVALSVPALGVSNIVLNPRFEDLDSNGAYGDFWGNWGATSFNNFFGRPHASLWGDSIGNSGGVFQGQIPGTAGKSYQFDLLNVRIESSWDATLLVGLEYYDSNDATKLGETFVTVNTAARVANGQVDGNVISMKGTAVPGTVYVRPVFRFEYVNPEYWQQPQANIFVFDTYLSQAALPGQEFLKNPAFEEKDAGGRYGYYWGNWGNTDFNSFWGSNGHASFFADQVGNSGGVYQASVLGTPGDTYRFRLTDVRIEQNFDADLFFGLEYYGADNFTKLGETIQLIDTSTTGDGLSFEMSGTAVGGTVYVRPVIRFDNVGYSGGSNRNAFVFATAMTDTTGLVLGDLNCDGSVTIADIIPFVTALLDPAQYAVSYPSCSILFADMNGDGRVDGADISQFVQAVIEG